MAKKMQKTEKQGAGSSVGIYLIGIVAVVAVVAVVILIQQAKGASLNLPSATDSVTGLASAGNIELCIMKAREEGVLIEKKLWNPRTVRYELKNNLKSSEVSNYLSACRDAQRLKKRNLNVNNEGYFRIKGSTSTQS